MDFNGSGRLRHHVRMWGVCVCVFTEEWWKRNGGIEVDNHARSILRYVIPVRSTCVYIYIVGIECVVKNWLPVIRTFA